MNKINTEPLEKMLFRIHTLSDEDVAKIRVLLDRGETTAVVDMLITNDNMDPQEN